MRELNADEQNSFDLWRAHWRSTLPEKERDIIDTTVGKLRILQLALDQMTGENHELLQGLGILFGDALAAQLGLRWVVVTDSFGISPVVIRSGTTFHIGAFSAIEKRVVNGEVPVDVGALLTLSATAPIKSCARRNLFGAAYLERRKHAHRLRRLLS